MKIQEASGDFIVEGIMSLGPDNTTMRLGHYGSKPCA